MLPWITINKAILILMAHVLKAKNAKVIRAFLLVDLIYIQSFFQAHGPPRRLRFTAQEPSLDNKGKCKKEMQLEFYCCTSSYLSSNMKKKLRIQ